MKNSRRTAAFIISKWMITKDFPANLLPEKGMDRAFIQDLVYTVIRRYRPLRSILSKLLKTWPKGELEALLYVGAAQILYMKDVPDFAAVNETVEAAKECENKNIAKVVNGVLRNIIRRREEFENYLKSAPVEERESIPSELYRRWVKRFGAEIAEKNAIWHNLPAETFLGYPNGKYEKLERGKKVTEVPGFEEGEFIVQNPATYMAVEAMEAKEGKSVLDACAAPGGKTIQLAWTGAKVTACEVNPKRRRKLIENLKRVHLEDKVEVVDSLEALKGREFDSVLVDAPCSNTGVLRRRPDARWNWSEEKVASLVKLQSEILELAAPLVKKGGLLVYSTCSNEFDENVAQVDSFLVKHSEFSKIGVGEIVPGESEDDTGKDGAFEATLLKN